MKDQNLFDKDFPDTEERRKHVNTITDGHKIKSWFRTITDIDTTINEFSCEVFFDKKLVKYVVRDLKIKESNLSKVTNELESDTVTINLEYYGWFCPCPQWITQEDKKLYESKTKGENEHLDLFINVRPANDSIPNPFDLTEDMKNLKFEFTGQFYIEPQLLGDEGEQGPARTLLYYSVKH